MNTELDTGASKRGERAAACDLMDSQFAESILQSSAVATFVIDKSHKVIFWKYSREEFEGKKKWTSLVATKEDLARMKHYHRMRRMGPGMAPKAYRFDLIDKKGNVRSMYINIDVVPGTKQSIASMLDITERMRARQAVERFHRNQEDALKTEVGKLTALVAQLREERNSCASAFAATPRSKKQSAESKEREKLGESLRELEATLDTSLTKEIKVLERGIKRLGKKPAKK